MRKKAAIATLIALVVTIAGVGQAYAAPFKPKADYTYKNAQSCASKTKAYNRGDSGTCVAVLQEGLKDAGYKVEKDGRFGEETEAVLNRCKDGQPNLEPNGWAGYGTYRALVPFMANADYLRQSNTAE